jgi:hypothetical protein
MRARGATREAVRPVPAAGVRARWKRRHFPLPCLLNGAPSGSCGGANESATLLLLPGRRAARPGARVCRRIVLVSEQPQSGSSIRWEEPDTCVTRFVGDVTEDELRRLLVEWNRMIAGRRYSFQLIDLSRFGGLSSEARKVARELKQEPHTRGTAIFGASWQARAITAIFTRAVNLIQGNTDNPLRFFDTEAQARAWLAERRRMVQTGGIKPA